MEADDDFAFFNKILSKKRTSAIFPEALAAEEAIANPEFESAEKVNLQRFYSLKTNDLRSQSWMSGLRQQHQLHSQKMIQS